MTTQLRRDLEELYNEDYLLWIDRTAQQIRQRNIDNLDWEHLLEEIEDLGKSQRNAV